MTAIDTAGDQRVSRLDGDQSAEAMAQHKNWPDPQRATGCEEKDTKPANRVAVDGPEVLPVRVGWQVNVQQPDQDNGYDDPAVATILTHTRAEISSGEKRCARQREECDRESDQCRVGEEGREPAPAEHGQAKLGSGAYSDESQPLGCYHHQSYSSHAELSFTSHRLLTMVVSMSNESGSQTYEDRAWQYFLQLQPSITDVNAAAELAFRAVDAFERQLKRRTGRDG